jgi:NAD+ synthase (glutamine-hydrolysing)
LELLTFQKNPIGSIDKSDLKRFIAWAEKNFNLPCLHEFLTAVPTAELEPILKVWIVMMP